MSQFLTILLAVTLSAQTSPPVQGDPALIEILQTAQKANENRYPHGRLRLTAEHKNSDPKAPSLQLEGTLIWNGDHYRCEGVLTNSALPPEDPINTQSAKRGSFIFISTNSKTITCSLRSKIVRIDPASNSGPPALVPGPPRESWYRIGNRPLIELLGPHPNFPQTKIASYFVERTGNDQITLTRKSLANNVMKAKASLSHDGNIIELVSERSDGSWSKDLFHWAFNSEGKLYVSELRHEAYMFIQLEDKGWSRYYTVTKTSEFDPRYRPPEGLFEIGSLSLPPGTKVEDSILKKTYRIGGEPLDSMIDQLPSLIELMKQNGFAKP